VPKGAPTVPFQKGRHSSILILEIPARFDYLCLTQTENDDYVPLGTQKDPEDRHAMALVIPVRALPFV
jgi:hypothetical protein